MGLDAGPEINLAIQVILNCGKFLGGTCDGGNAGGAYRFVLENGGIPYDTCQNYMADDTLNCTGQSICKTCYTFGDCFAIPKHTSIDGGGSGMASMGIPNVTIDEHGGFVGPIKMQAEILARGPISCGIDADGLFGYTGGIINNTVDDSINHIVSVVGWGVEERSNGESVPYWRVRNSWGEFWGEQGFFRIKRGDNILKIESDCTWAQPHQWSHIVDVESGNSDQRVTWDKATVTSYWRTLTNTTTDADDDASDQSKGSGDGTDEGSGGLVMVLNSVDLGDMMSIPQGFVMLACLCIGILVGHRNRPYTHSFQELSN